MALCNRTTCCSCPRGDGRRHGLRPAGVLPTLFWHPVFSAIFGKRWAQGNGGGVQSAIFTAPRAKTGAGGLHARHSAPKALAVPDGGLPLCPLIRCLERIVPQQRPLRRLGLCGDEAAQDGTRDLVAALKWRGACDRKARSHAINCRTATDDAMDWGLVRGRGRGGAVGQQGPPHPVLGIRNFFVFFSYFGNAGPREMGVGSSVGDFTARARQDRGWGGQNAKHSSGTAQLPV